MTSTLGVRTMGLRRSWSPAGMAVVAACLGILLLNNGCTVASVGLSVASGVGSTAYDEYRSGEYAAAVEASRRVCEVAAWESCQRFGLSVYDWQVDEGVTKAKLQSDRGDSFTIRIAYVGPERTALYIRAGLWGDDLCSRQLACDIEAGALRLRRAARAAPRAAKAARAPSAPGVPRAR